MRKKKNNIDKQGMFANIVWPPKLANIRPCCVLLIYTINGNCIFSNSLAKLANMPQGKKVGKHTSPQPWGAERAHLEHNNMDKQIELPI